MKRQKKVKKVRCKCFKCGRIAYRGYDAVWHGPHWYCDGCANVKRDKEGYVISDKWDKRK